MLAPIGGWFDTYESFATTLSYSKSFTQLPSGAAASARGG
jgi:hypothetical protein